MYLVNVRLKIMKSFKKILAAITALSAIISCTAGAEAADGGTVNITVSTSKERKIISPYIYGVSSELMDNNVSTTSVRAGGNRFSAYNWETNASNAGADWKHISADKFPLSDLNNRNIIALEKRISHRAREPHFLQIGGGEHFGCFVSFVHS